MLWPGVFYGAEGPRGVEKRWHLVIRSWEDFLRRYGGGRGHILGESVGACCVRQGVENKKECKNMKHGSTERSCQAPATQEGEG